MGRAHHLDSNRPGPSQTGARNSNFGRVPPWITLIGILLISLNLRAPIVALSPVLPEVQSGLNLGRGAAGLLTALPVLCFGALSVAVSPFGRRFGTERVLLAAMLGLAVGVMLRSAGGLAAMLLGTLLIGVFITVGNVLVPGLIKQDFPKHTGVVTGIYVAALNGGAGIAALATGPVHDELGFDWQATLFLWCLPALLAAVVWLPQARRRSVPVLSAVTPGALWRNVVAWHLAVFMGAQALTFYALTAWLPTLLQEQGVSATRAGWALSTYALTGIGTSLLLPVLAARRRDQRGLAIATCTTWGVGLGGLMAAPSHYLIWATVTGLAQGAGISLAFAMVVLRASTPAVASQLSGMVQSIGYLLAAAGPYALGALRDASHGWLVPLWFLVAVIGVMAASSLVAARDRQIG